MVFLVAFTSVVNAQDEYPRDLALQMRNKAKQFGLGKPELDPPNITPTGKGFYVRYSGGNVYYNPTTKGIYVVYGDILSKWGALGWENGALGFPTSDEKDSDKAGWKRMSTFDKGIIYWNDGKFVGPLVVVALKNGDNPPLLFRHLEVGGDSHAWGGDVECSFQDGRMGSACKRIQQGNHFRVQRDELG